MSAPKKGDLILVCHHRAPDGRTCAYIDRVPRKVRTVRKDGFPTINILGDHQVVRSWVRL